jgi:predicted transcriptional regulator
MRPTSWIDVLELLAAALARGRTAQNTEGETPISREQGPFIPPLGSP